MRKYILPIFILLSLFSGQYAKGEDNRWESLLSGFNAGLGGTVITNEYKDMGGDATLLPLIGYEGEYVYLRGVAAGFHFFKNDWLELNAQVSYLPQHFYADDSDDWAIRRLDDRYSSLLGGFNGRLISDIGIIGLTVSTDLLGYSNGIIADANYTYPLMLGKVSIAPTVGLQYTDVNYNRYYYGVTESEARRSGLEYYEPESSISPYGQVSAKFNFTDKWSAFASVRALLLNEQIYDSPMVETPAKFSFSLGAMYNF